MEVLFVLVPLSILLILLALRAFAWAIDSGQFDDLDRESLRILMDARGDPQDRGPHATDRHDEAGDAAPTREERP